MHSLELFVKPGVVTAVLFIVLDIFIVGILDLTISRIVCLAYHRTIARGGRISVKSADVPGLSHYLLGRPVLSATNVCALSTKVALLAVILTVNLSIQGSGTYSSVVTRDATFEFDPAGSSMRADTVTMVRRREKISTACVVQHRGSEVISYYPLRFNLAKNPKLDASDVSQNLSDRDFIEIDDTSVICTSPQHTTNTRPLAVVEGCSQGIPSASCHYPINSWRSQQASEIEFMKKEKTMDSVSGIPYQFIEYNAAKVRQVWTEYSNPHLTCIQTFIGGDAVSKGARYRGCFLVGRTPSRDSTVVEFYFVRALRSNNGSIVKENIFSLKYPGAVFRGALSFSAEVLGRAMLQTEMDMDYRSMSGILVAEASRYRHDPQTIGVFHVVPNGTVTIINMYVVGLVGVAMALVVAAFVGTAIFLRQDHRPSFNTIDGLSSIIREEARPTGCSLDRGETAVLGLQFANEDSLRFGPLAKREECIPYQDCYDIS